ncbi:hypothetical protein NP233_g10460 [Leucocoprinus birnbaumii]|uniref:Uncharacterized protein n=1 Tax=Leucocoprinus birnbaumii TaxID=56174 RepID=A0AAD5VIF6_9AGAR|nr:hypothetical protein NP233_g10460 [Leucocoprinus birnbaumii]
MGGPVHQFYATQSVPSNTTTPVALAAQPPWLPQLPTQLQQSQFSRHQCHEASIPRAPTPCPTPSFSVACNNIPSYDPRLVAKLDMALKSHLLYQEEQASDMAALSTITPSRVFMGLLHLLRDWGVHIRHLPRPLFFTQSNFVGPLQPPAAPGLNLSLQEYDGDLGAILLGVETEVVTRVD